MPAANVGTQQNLTKGRSFVKQTCHEVLGGCTKNFCPVNWLSEESEKPVAREETQQDEIEVGKPFWMREPVRPIQI